LGFGILLESTDTSAHDVRALQQRLSLPVLAAIPKIWLDSDRAVERRARIRSVLAVGLLIVFAQVGGAANYLWVNGNPLAKSSETSADAASDSEPAATDDAGDSEAADAEEGE
jgi:hypothetical protein